MRQTSDSKQTEQRERKDAITANTLRLAIIEVCGKPEDCQHHTAASTVRLIGRIRYMLINACTYNVLHKGAWPTDGHLVQAIAMRGGCTGGIFNYPH